MQIPSTLGQILISSLLLPGFSSLIYQLITTYSTWIILRVTHMKSKSLLFLSAHQAKHWFIHSNIYLSL